jgi:hypothetical protein
MVAVDVHVPKGLFWRQMLLSVWSYPEGLSMNAVEAAPAHSDFLRKAQTKSTATTIAKNGKL